jgi:type IV pilus assembly protein PilW
VDYGLDNQPAGVNPATQSIGDGVPDQYTATPALADWRNTVTAKVFVLARSPRRTAGHTDTKAYNLGLAGTTAAANDAFKRHVFSAAVRLVDVGGRREIPE